MSESENTVETPAPESQLEAGTGAGDAAPPKGGAETQETGSVKIKLSDGRELSPSEAAKEIERLRNAEKEFKRAFTKKTSELAAERLRLKRGDSAGADAKEARHDVRTREDDGEEEPKGRRQPLLPDVSLLSEMFSTHIDYGKERLERIHGALSPEEERAFYDYLSRKVDKHGELPPLEEAYKFATWDSRAKGKGGAEQASPPPSKNPATGTPPKVPSSAAGSGGSPGKSVKDMTDAEFRAYQAAKYPNIFGRLS